jgi:Recombination endonuclease VII
LPPVPDLPAWRSVYPSVARTILREVQGGVCAACLVRFYARHGFDHDHETGLVRGLLCTGCNFREGHPVSRTHPLFVAYRAFPPAYAGDWHYGSCASIERQPAGAVRPPAVPEDPWANAQAAREMREAARSRRDLRRLT